jgi:multidrug efflux pump
VLTVSDGWCLSSRTRQQHLHLNWIHRAVGLASKNAILIVEFARQQMLSGEGRIEAAAEASRLRLRPILMTSFAFILGVLPLVIAKGAGAEMDQALGTTVFAEMIGVTFFGIFLTPVFFSVIMGTFARIPKEEQGSTKRRVPRESLVHGGRQPAEITLDPN